MQPSLLLQPAAGFRRVAALALLTAGLAGPASAQNTRPTQWVNPFVGTDGSGHTFPGASLPFGMVAPGPDNADTGWPFSSGYQYKAPRILGFSNTHISGAGIPELGDVLLQPAIGTPWTALTTDFSSRYDKASEAARPGYYAVTLAEHGVRVELTATQRVALHRYTFSRSGRVQVLVDLQHGLRIVDKPRVTGSQVEVDTARGEVSGTLHLRNWVEREASFVLRFDRPVLEQDILPPRTGELAPRVLLTFDLHGTRVLQARVALSTVDVDGARRNLAQVDSQRFDGVRQDAGKTWDKLLGRIGIGATEAQRRVFYTALYHTMLHPSDIADVDGRVRGPTGEVINARGGSYYSTLSLWDTFRAVHPLLTLIVPERIDGFIRTLLDHHRAMKTLPLWTVWGRETWSMIGNPSLPVIADAVLKNFKGFDEMEALQAMVTTSTEPRLHAPAWAQFDWSLLDRYGWLPFDLVDGEAVSKTLEAGIGDDAVARVARALGRNDLARAFSERSQAYRSLLDPETQLMRGRDSKGRWRTPFNPLTVTAAQKNPGDYTQANAWQTTQTPALHDPRGMVDLMGGRQPFRAWLDRFFAIPERDAGPRPGAPRPAVPAVPRGEPSSPAEPDLLLGQEGLIGQYAQGNEPGHHLPWLYAYTDRPWRSHDLARHIVRNFYRDKPDGLPGNDDCGQLSAWLVFATMGLYPVIPGSAHYVLGAPLVRQVRIELPTGRVLEFQAPALNDNNRHAARITIDGEPWTRPDVPHWRLAQARTVAFTMRPPPAE